MFMKTVKCNLFGMLFLLSVFCLLFSFDAGAKDMTVQDLVQGAKGSIRTISVSDANAMLGKSGVVFLDVREPAEFKAGHVPGALNIPRGLLEFQIGQEAPDKDATLVVYCKGGGRSALATAALVRMGYKNPLNLDGGWNSWLNAGYQAE
jgi:rhodanese-related sulfurtransferase